MSPVVGSFQIESRARSKPKNNLMDAIRLYAVKYESHFDNFARCFLYNPILSLLLACRMTSSCSGHFGSDDMNFISFRPWAVVHD